MRPTLLISAVVTALGAAPAIAMPAAPAPSTSRAITQIAAGCGMGRTRDAMGRCHHPFNRFHHHHQFNAYKAKHCKPMRTPNGTVGFCKV